MNFWTDEKLVHLRSLAGQGLSAKKISNEFSVSRNSIIGICRRKKIGLLYKTHYAKPKRAGAPRAPKIPKKTECKRPRAHIPSRMLKVMELEVKPDPCNIVQLAGDRCHWPLWSDDGTPFSEKFYCGAATDGGVWCNAHRAKVTQMPVIRKRDVSRRHL